MNTVGGAEKGPGEWEKLLGRERQSRVAGEHRLGGQRHELESKFFCLPAQALKPQFTSLVKWTQLYLFRAHEGLSCE